jgi:hypothetical protein
MNKATATISGTTRSYEGGGVLVGIRLNHDPMGLNRSFPKPASTFRDHALSARRAGFEPLQAIGGLLE